MDLRKHTRRDFIRLTGLATAGVAIAACAPRAPEVVEKIVEVPVEVPKEVVKEVVITPTPPPVPKFRESPLLAARVERGELPPVEERLPEEPRICEVYERVGDYGGTLTVGDLTMAMLGGDLDMSIDRPNWLRITKDGTGAIPHTLINWEMTPDFVEVTCHIRKGIKWSDGVPVTTEDVRYWFEDMVLNVEIIPVPNIAFRRGGTMMTLTVVDDYTYKFTFGQPNPSFVLVNMAHVFGIGGFVPSHFLREFHIKYNENADDLAVDAGFDFWYQLHGRMNSRGLSIDRPRLESIVPIRDTPAMAFWERNPYYHAVDPEGNQLPYIDKYNLDRCADLTVLDAKTVGGSFDFGAFQLRVIYFSSYADGAALADAYMITWPSGKGSECVYNVNMTWPNEEWRNVFSDMRFRQALSLAINRQEINDVVYFGAAENRQMTVIPQSRHYRPEYSAAWADFDPDRANALLDEMGLEWNAAGTHRLWPVSKQPIIISWNLVEIETPKGPITQLVTEYWKAIGVEITWKSITRTLLTQRILANEEPMSLWHGDETADTLFLRRPKFFAPLSGDESCWGVPWGLWYATFGEQGEEPPQIIKDLYNWLDEYMLTDSDEPARKVLESQMENMWTIGSVGMAPHPLFLRNNLKNVSQTGGLWTWDTLWTFPEFPEQWFIEI